MLATNAPKANESPAKCVIYPIPKPQDTYQPFVNIESTGLKQKQKKTCHILCHAEKEEIFGVSLMEELSRHGYEIGDDCNLVRRLKGGYSSERWKRSC